MIVGRARKRGRSAAQGALQCGPNIEFVRVRLEATLLFREYLKERRSFLGSHPAFSMLQELISAILQCMAAFERALKDCAHGLVQPSELENDLLPELRGALVDLQEYSGGVSVPASVSEAASDVAEPLIEQIIEDLARQVEAFLDQSRSVFETVRLCRPRWMTLYESELKREGLVQPAQMSASEG